MAAQVILWVSFALQMLGAAIATICYAPGAHKVIKSNDTRSISTPMFILTSSGCLLWIIIGILNMIGFFLTQQGNIVTSLAGGLGTIISNVGLLTCGMIIFVYKIRNLYYSKKLRMNEEEYYQSCGHYKHWKTVYLTILERQKLQTQKPQ